MKQPSPILGALAALILTASSCGSSGGVEGVPEAFVFDSLEESLDVSEGRAIEILDVFGLSLADATNVSFRANNCRGHEDWTYTLVTKQIDSVALDEKRDELDALMESYGFPYASHFRPRADWRPEEESLEGFYAHIGVFHNDEDGDFYIKVSSGCSPADSTVDFEKYTSRVG